jgi:hypothetical protein
MSLQSNRVPLKNSAARGPRPGLLLDQTWPGALVPSASDQPSRKNSRAQSAAIRALWMAFPAPAGLTPHSTNQTARTPRAASLGKHLTGGMVAAREQKRVTSDDFTSRPEASQLPLAKLLYPGAHGSHY